MGGEQSVVLEFQDEIIGLPYTLLVVLETYVHSSMPRGEGEERGGKRDLQLSIFSPTGIS